MFVSKKKTYYIRDHFLDKKTQWKILCFAAKKEESATKFPEERWQILKDAQ